MSGHAGETSRNVYGGRAACLAQSIPFIARDEAPGNPSV
jgi:hypothetical protein